MLQEPLHAHDSHGGYCFSTRATLSFCWAFLLPLPSGCASNTYDVARDLGREGYAIWYPAESGI